MYHKLLQRLSTNHVEFVDPVILSSIVGLTRNSQLVNYSAKNILTKVIAKGALDKSLLTLLNYNYFLEKLSPFVNFQLLRVLLSI